MKKLLIFFVLFVSMGISIAGPHHSQRNNQGQHSNRGGHHGSWIAPVIIGGIIGYGLSRPYYYPPPIVYQYPPVYIGPPQKCTTYIYKDQYGNTTREETYCKTEND